MSAMERGKRVRFEYDEPDEDEDQSGPRKLKFPKGKKGALEVQQESVAGEEEDGPDARIAAVERAARRNAMDEQLRTAEDMSNITDVVEAEEDEEDGENGTKMEPFNLNAERRDGFFDDKGHYIEYETKYEARDAWLDSAEVDTRFAHQLTEDPDDTAAELTEEEKGQLKKRISAILQPGETVLEALRRLKGPNSKNRREKMTGETKVAFDQLTENAMKLMDHGESDVYQKVRETFQREADAAMVKPKVVDMFSDDADADETPAALPATVTPKSPVAQGLAESGYIYDSSSGYYYNASSMYYYDAGCGLFCNSTSGKWFKFDEATDTYIEMGGY